MYTPASQPNFVQGSLAANQVTDIAVNDHIKFDTVVLSVASQVGSAADIVLDTTTAYNSGNGVPSVGRITLRPGKRYDLYGNISVNMSAGPGSSLQCAWFNASAGTQLGQIAAAFHQTAGVASTVTIPVQAVIQPTAILLVEIRFTTVVNFTGLSAGLNSIHIREIG